ncbi:MAG: NUDIX hydrolase [Parcubacteria group bacterium]|nr:NUDIX hydrolase [Parcubacteria group bacterium]
MYARVSQEEINFAPGENTFGLRVFKEVWHDPSTGKKKTFWRYGLPDIVMVMGFTTGGEVITIEEFQPGASTVYKKLVGGSRKDDEDPAVAAKRELLEETGYQAGTVELLTTLVPDVGRGKRRLFAFLARDCTKVARGEKDIHVLTMDPLLWWEWLHNYLLASPEENHGGTNSLITTDLAFAKLGLVQAKKSGGGG